MSVDFDSNIDYKKKIHASSNYRYKRLLPIGGNGQSVVTSVTSNVQTQFEIPSNVVNLSRSKLKFTVALPASGANNYNWSEANMTKLFDRITLQTRGGTTLADLSHCGKFHHVATPLNTKSNDLKNKKLGVLKNASVVLSKHFPVSDIQASNAAAGSNYVNSASVSVTPNYAGYRYLFPGTVNTAEFIGVELDLDAFKDSLFTIDKSMWFGGDSLILNITWAATNTWNWWGTSATVPVTDAAAVAALTVSNLELFVCKEEDPVIINQLVNKASSPEGFSLNIPYVYSQKLAVTNATSADIQQRITRGYGSTLLKVYSAMFNNVETLSTNYINRVTDENNAPIMSSYHASLDGNRLNDFTVDVAENLHWLVNEENIKGSCIEDVKMYNETFAHVENFCGKPLVECDPTQQQGLDLNIDRIYSFNCNMTSASYKMYMFFVCQRTLVVQNGVVALI